ncbi:MAG: hypothetical protein HPY68_01340 [Candidatus Atribacteria bacterium]|nr:hypothetical protein [Candidatus Atribacteria bacterium]
MKTWLGLLVAIVAIILAVVPFSQVSRLGGQLQEMEARFGEMGKKVENVEGTLKTLPGDFSQLSERLGGVEEQVKATLELGQKVDALATSVENLKNFQVETEKTIINAQARLGEVEKRAKGTEDTLTQMGERLGMLEEKSGRLSEMESLLGTVSQKVDSLSSSFQQIAATQLDEKKAIGEFQERIGNQEKETGELKQALKVLDEKWQSWVGRLEHLESLAQSSLEQVKMLQDRVKTVEQGIAAQDTKMGAILQELREGLGEFQKTLSALNVDQRFSALLKYVQDKDKELRSLWEDLERRLQEEGSALQGFESKVKGELEALNAVLEELKQNIAVLRGEIEKKLQILSSSFQEVQNLLGEKVKEWETISQNLAAIQKEYVSQNRWEEFVSEWQKQLQVFEGSLKDLEAKMSEKWKGLEERLGKTESLFNEQSRRMEEIRGEIEPAIEALKGKISVLESDFEKNKVWIMKVENKLGESAGTVEKLYKDIEEAGQSIALWEGKLQELESWKEGLEKEIGEKVGKALEELPDKAKLEALEKEMATVLSQKEEILSQLRFWYEERGKLQQELEGRRKDIENLEKRIAEEEATGRAAQETLVKMKEELENLSGLRRELEGRLDQFNSQISTLEAGLKEYEAKMDNLVSAMNLEVQRLAKSVETIQEDLGTLKSEGVALPPNVAQALDNLEKGFEEVSQRLREVEGFAQNFFRMGIETKISSMGEEIQAVAKKIESMMESYPATSAEIESLRKMVEELRQGKLDIEKRFENLTQEVENLKKGKEIMGDVESLNQEKEQLRQEIESLAGERINLESELQKKQYEVEKIKGELQKLETEKGGSAEEINRLRETLRRAEEGVDILKRQLQEKEGQIEVLQRRNEELTRRLEETEKYTSYVILPWDNLWTIARRYYRDGRKWKAILEANRNIITDPYKLQPYVEIKIPRQTVDVAAESEPGEK